MFCPNCATHTDTTQHYCRICGLNLDSIAANVAEQRPSAEFTLLLKRKRRLELFGIAAMSIAGVIAVSMLLAGALFFKLQFFSFEILMRSASIALVLFALASAVLLFYPKLFMRVHKLKPSEPAENPIHIEAIATSKLLADSPFEPASVTENSTELLKTPNAP
jgi:hypothetical protein